MANHNAVKVGRITLRKPAEPTMHNPYSLVPLKVNGKPIDGRPVAWDREIEDHANLRGAGGEEVRPTVVHTLCPDCSAFVEVSIAEGTELDCPSCRPKVEAVAPPPPPDPFINPFESGIINFDEMNLDLISMLGDIPTDTVADRLNQ